MVKADPRLDYYADLEIPSTADNETIKRRFRELAKQYHPDRNPGREVDVVPKFQAIQAAHEILGDPIQKAKYDAERAKLNGPSRATDSPTFKKPAPPPPRPTPTYANGNPINTPNTARRDQSGGRYAPATPGSASRRPNSASSTGADKFAQFAKAAPQQWDRSRFEDAARADAARGFGAMRGGAPQTSPMRSRPHPTARQPPPNAYVDASGPGFPGLGRTDNSRAEPPGTPNTAYAHYRERRSDASSTNLRPQSQTRSSTARSPLRQTRSSHFDDVQPNSRPPISRTSSRYANAGIGEKTAVNTGNLSRSTSARNSRRNSPNRSYFDPHSPEDQTHRPRPRSLSPQMSPGAKRPGEPVHESADTSSDEESQMPEMRSKAAPRPRSRFPQKSFTQPEQAFTGYFPSTNYTKLVSEDQYEYPAPETKSFSRKPFSDFPAHLAHDPSHPDDASAWEPKPNDANTSQAGTGQEKMQSGFSADHWHNTLSSHDGIFTPPERPLSGQRSPRKGSRAARNIPEKTFTTTKEQGQNGTSSIPGMSNTTAKVFQAGKLPNDFAEKVKSFKSNNPPAADISSKFDAPDAMDVDTPGASSAEDHVTVEEDQSTSEDSAANDTNTSGSLNMDDLHKQAPFAPSREGLKDLNDLSANLPFQSRAEISSNLQRAHSSTLKELDLPKIPTAPVPPADDAITQHTWRAYTEAMSRYMQLWNEFNTQMIIHFQTRQNDVAHHMFRNWITALGDGASAESFEASGGNDLAGYGTYMAWLRDDQKCRAWWEMASERHSTCMENLGKIRGRVKQMCGRTT